MKKALFLLLACILVGYEAKINGVSRTVVEGPIAKVVTAVPYSVKYQFYKGYSAMIRKYMQAKQSLKSVSQRFDKK